MDLICNEKQKGIEMKNLKEKILNLFNGKNNIDDIMDDVSNYQKKLAENISNPLFNKNAKNKMLKMCADLHSLEKSLYRYNVAKQYNHLTEMQEEQENAKDIILKGGISNVRYIWRAENSEKTCDECSDLDGQEFDLYDDIPPMPHPNCKCYIDVIATNPDTTQENKSIPPVNKNTTQKPATDTTPKSTTNTTKPNWIMPCNGRIVGVYGEQRATHVHNGIDIAVPIGTPVKAIADGVVINSGKAQGYGYWVVINHGKINGKIVTSEYGHLSSWNVKKGQKITQGQVIAKSGNTGHSQGPHLHITIREGAFKGTAVNPYNYINRH